MTDGLYDPARAAAHFRATGLWQDRLIDDALSEAVAAAPHRTALICYRTDRTEIVRLTYRDLETKVASAAGSLRALGIGAGDVIAIQLPNWWEFIVATLATMRLGAIPNPLMPIFREREMLQMLAVSEAKLLLVPKAFRDFDHAAMAQELKPALPALRAIVVVDETGPNGFEPMLLQSSHPIDPADPSVAFRHADDPAVLMFTSGTTGAPRGVVHTSNTLLSCTKSLADRLRLDGTDVLHACSPMGHMTGFAATLLLGISIGATMVLQDIWEGRRGVAMMVAEGVTHAAAATPFLNDICDIIAGGGHAPKHLRSFLCGGAPISPILIERAKTDLNLDVCSLWGMTEALAGTLTEPSRAAEKSSRTDGRALNGVELRIIDDAGQTAATGATGRLLVRGAQMFQSYFNRPEIPTRDPDGWFDTGDLAYMDSEGYIRIDGRIKDVLVRGGENVPVVEIEALMYKHPSVAAAAIVGFPDERLGERACLFVELRQGCELDLSNVQQYMALSKVAKQYWPERLRIVGALPRTPSGKIKKFELKAEATDVSAAGASVRRLA